MPFHLFKGTFHVKDYSPDGDTIRFDPDDESLLSRLDGPPAKFNARRHIPLRLEGIDTLETHFAGLKQPPPLADDATDFLLNTVGITNVVWSNERRSVRSADDGVRGHIMARGTDKYKRVIAFAFPDEADDADGAEIFLDADRLTASANFKLAESGMAYPTYYWGLFADLRDALTEAADAARAARRGVYAVDKTNEGFEVSALSTVTDEVVMMPKLFRRLATYIEDTGGVAGFKQALEASAEPVLDLRENNFTHFDTFVEQQGSALKLTRRPEEFVFDPMPQRIETDFNALLAAAANTEVRPQEASEFRSANVTQNSEETKAFSRRVDSLRR
jgi:endonuclease YncB( thermonuclease family)